MRFYFIDKQFVASMVPARTHMGPGPWAGRVLSFGKTVCSKKLVLDKIASPKSQSYRCYASLRCTHKYNEL